MFCPGTFGSYSCALENNSFVVSGLRHSAVAESYFFCGDGVCDSQTGESCSSCSSDCGTCPSGGNPGGGGSGGGGSGGGGASNGNVLNGTPIDNGSYVPQENDDNGSSSSSSNGNGATSSSSGLLNSLKDVFSNKWIVWSILILAVIIVLVAIILVLMKGRKGTDNPKKSSYYESSDKDKLIEEVKELLDEGERMFSLGNIVGARDRYTRIKKDYEHLDKIDPALYSRLMAFYKELSGKY